MTLIIMRTTKDKFLSKISKTNSCWLWIGPLTNRGYGQFSDSGKRCLAHRYSFRIHKCQEIPSGLYVCHHCDNPRCVNPDHLFLGTNSDNQLDASRKGRLKSRSDAHVRGESHSLSKLTEQQVLYLRSLPSLKGYRKRLALEWGVWEETIADAYHRRSWIHVGLERQGK